MKDNTEGEVEEVEEDFYDDSACSSTPGVVKSGSASIAAWVGAVVRWLNAKRSTHLTV